MELWLEARRSYQKAADIWSDLDRHGKAQAAPAEWKDRIARAIAQCNAALSKLGAVAGDGR